MRHFFIPLAAAVLLAACASNNIGSSSAFTTDSWSAPTIHGELSFEATNRAEFTASQRFHGWHFTLTAQAQVVLETVLKATNLDTVIYLYNADENGKKHGAYLAKNDDADNKTMASKLAKDLPAGNYFLQVKAGRELMRGRFEVQAGCTGPGCPFDEVLTAQDYCESTDEGIGKCVDDSLDATLEECAPYADSAGAVLCCNQHDEWYCEGVCTDQIQLAEIWGIKLHRAEEAFPETPPTSTLMDVKAYAIAVCANPSLDDVQAAILDADTLIGDDSWNVHGWIQSDGSNFVAGDTTPELLDTLNGIAGEPATARWSASVDLPCHACDSGYAKDAYYFPVSGKVIVFDIAWGED